MKNMILLLLFLIYITSQIMALEEQNYQVRVLVDENRREALIFPLPDISYEREKEVPLSLLTDKKNFVLMNHIEPVPDLCGIIPPGEDR